MNFQDIENIINSREDISIYSSNSLMLWALQIRYQIEDIDEFASSYLTDNNDDKKCDLIWVNRDEGFAIIAQCYKKSISSTDSAPANKASDLNTAVAWVFGNEDIINIPETIRFGVQDIRLAISKQQINQIFFYYFHNLKESKNVENELRQVKLTAENYIQNNEIDIFVKEVGQNTLIEWYENIQNPILVTDDIEISYDKGFFLEESNWKSFITNISGKQLKDWFTTYGEPLFSANHRNYLGSRNSDKNINNGIKSSAIYTPSNFWVYNNGVSIITNNINLNTKSKKITLSGISIINGAQTTGSIGTITNDLDDSLLVICRFIECHDKEIIKEIVKYNNLQNKIISSDFRSNDRIQKRLVTEFEKYKGENLLYSGGKRGGISDSILRRPNLISSDTVAQSLTAFHGRPDIGYQYKSRIWEENEDYERIFNDKVTSSHILFVFSLFKEIIDIRVSLKQKEVKNYINLTEEEKNQLDYFNARGSVFVLIYAISKSMEVFTNNQRINDKFNLKFSKPDTIKNYQTSWKPIIIIALSFSKQLLNGLQNYSLSMENIEKSLDNFTSLVQAVASPNSQIIQSFSEKVIIKKY